jgi:hypothetical protein
MRRFMTAGYGMNDMPERVPARHDVKVEGFTVESAREDFGFSGKRNAARRYVDLTNAPR